MLAQLAREDPADLHSHLLQELCTTVRAFRARAALPRRVELGEAAGLPGAAAAAALVLRASSAGS